jgi:hypothetical protein
MYRRDSTVASRSIMYCQHGPTAASVTSLEVDTLLQEYTHTIFDVMSEADTMNTTNELQVQGSVDDESSDAEEDILESRTDGNTDAIDKKKAVDNKAKAYYVRNNSNNVVLFPMKNLPLATPASSQSLSDGFSIQIRTPSMHPPQLPNPALLLF